jgi:hypothetical protein
MKLDYSLLKRTKAGPWTFITYGSQFIPSTMVALKLEADEYRFELFHQGHKLGAGWVEAAEHQGPGRTRWYTGERLAQTMIDLVDALLRNEVPDAYEPETDDCGEVEEIDPMTRSLLVRSAGPAAFCMTRMPE